MTPRPGSDQSGSDPSGNEATQSESSSHAANAAERIIERFGGIRPMAHKLEVPVTTVQGWKKRGAIPVTRHADLQAAAARHGIDIDPAELAAAAPSDDRGDEDTLAAPQEDASGGPPAEDRGQEARPSALTPSAATPPGGTQGAAATGPGETGTGNARGARRLATAAALLSVVGIGIAISAPYWVPEVLPRVIGTQPPLAERVDALSNRVDALGTPAPDTDLTARLDRLEQDTQALRQQAGAAAPAVDAERMQAVTQRLDALEGTVQGLGGGVDAASLDQRLGELETRIADALRQLQQRIDQIESQAARTEPLSRSLATLESEANRLAQEVAQANSRILDLSQAVERRRTADSAAQALVLATGQLRAVMENGRPFQAELATIRSVADDPAIDTLLDRVAPYADGGVPTETVLRQRFDAVAPEILRADTLNGDGGWLDQSVARLGSLVSVRRQAGEVEGSGADAVVARAEARLDAGNLDGAISELQSLSGPAADAVRPWLADAEARAAANDVISKLSGAAIARLTGAPQETDGTAASGNAASGTASTDNATASDNAAETSQP